MGGDVASPMSMDTPSKPPNRSQTGLLAAQQQMVVDYLSMKVLTSKTPPVKVVRYIPMIVIHEDDACRLELLTGDEVLLLSMDNNESTIRKSAIARVHIATNEVTPTASSFSTPTKKLSLSKSQRANLSPGSCLIFPTTLSHDFQSTSTIKKIPTSNSTTQSTPHVSPIQSSTQSKSSVAVPPASPPKSQFSFAKGGGGDQLIFSPSHSTPKPAPSTPCSSQTNTLWVVPVDSNLGEKLCRLLCSKASQILLQPDLTEFDDASAHLDDYIAKWNGSLGQQLLQAHLLNSFISINNQVSLSFQGQSTKAKVISATVTEDPDNQAPTVDSLLEVGMGNLTLAEGSESTENAPEPHITRKLLVAAQNSTRKTSFGPSKALLYHIQRPTKILMGMHDGASTPQKLAVEGPPAPLLCGCDANIDQVLSLLTTPLVHPELFQGKQALKPPRGVLVFGPSGVGKSTLGQQIGQYIAYHYKVHVQSISCARLQAQTALVGQAEKELVEAFETASHRRPGKKGSLILLDDVHLICRRRQGNHAGADRLSSTLLALLDGVDDAGSRSLSNTNASFFPVVVLATTSNPSLLDAALRRPGRLDAEVEMAVPDEPLVRSNILRFLLSSMNAVTPAMTEEEWFATARLAKGFTGADMKLAVKEAIRSSVLKGADQPIGPSGKETYSLDRDALSKAIRSIKPTSIKAVTVEIPKVYWHSIGGMEEVKQQLREAIELPMTHGAMFERLGIRPARGVLLYGPPGCSKTLMARALATEGSMNFLAVKGPELLSKWLGESERALASLFRRARLASPSVIFFDEVDAIATKRGGGNSGGERLLSQLLTELDGVQTKDINGKKQRVVVVCATNRPDLLDSALLRPGRIDRMIYVGVPDLESRRKILEISLQKKACSNDIDFSKLAEDNVSGGFSGAELVGACRDAALLALEEEEALENLSIIPRIGMKHMVKALESMEKQITPGMIDFYMQYQGKRK